MLILVVQLNISDSTSNLQSIIYSSYNKIRDMNSALAATIGLILSIILIIKKVSPVYSLILGALTGGLLAGWGLENTVTEMISLRQLFVFWLPEY